MNILQINSVCGIGSTGRIATDIHSLLQSQGHQSTIAYGRNPARGCDNTIRIGNSLDNFVHVAFTRIFDSHGFGSAAATKKLISRIKALNPDVIHLHNVHGYYLHIGLLFDFLKKLSKPVIWTLHDCWPFTGHCAYFDFVGCERWRSQCYNCPLKSEYPKSLVLDRSRWNYQQKMMIFTKVPKLTIVTPSKWLAALVRNSFLKEYPVAVINNGIDLNVFHPISSDFRKRYMLENQFIILGVANPWSERKGYQYILDFAKRLRPDETIVLVGVSAEQIKHLPEGIIGIPKTNNAVELAEIYSSADLFINPTLEDNFPTTNIEALACGTPVITFDSGGSPECIDEKSGFVIKKFDLEGLLNAIKTVKENGKSHYSKYCQDLAKNLYNKDVKFAEYISLYQQ